MKTIDEAARKCAYDNCSTKGKYDASVKFGFEEGVEFAQRWIPVEEELPEAVKELIDNNIKSENVLIKRQWDDTGEITIEVNCRFRPSERIGFLWNVDYKGSKVTQWRPIERK